MSHDNRLQRTARGVPKGREEHEGDRKVVALGRAKNALSACIDEAQNGRILITRHGRPAALIVGVEGEEFEDLMTRSDPSSGG
jgi:prevent-host-death family protein